MHGVQTGRQEKKHRRKRKSKRKSQKKRNKNTGKNPADRAEYDSGRDRHGFFRRYGRFAGAGQLCPQEGCVVHCDAGGNADRYDLCFGEYGKEYDGGSWREGSATDPASVYLQYPSSLKQLRKLCNELQEADSFEEAERFVEETLKRQAVYDVNPGSTPSGEDFAEYFFV